MNGRARVEIIEIDLSTRVPSFPGTYGAMVLNTSKGDVLNPRLITSESELFRRMMSSETILPRDPLGLFEARIFLQKSNNLWLCRPDTGATYGGAYLAQDIPVDSVQVSVNQGQSGLFLRTTTEEEALDSEFIYDTLSDGDAVQLEGTALPSPLQDGTNYFIIKFSNEKYGIRLSETQEAALNGEYIVFTSAGNNVTLKFTPDDVNGEQQYAVRNPDGYELDTNDGKAAGFESTFTIDIDGDYLNVSEEFYKTAETGDSVTLKGNEEDLPTVDSGLPLDTDTTYYLIKVAQEGVNADKYKVQLARSEKDALSEIPIGLNSTCGSTFAIALDNKALETSATLDLDTDLFKVSLGFYAALSTNDKITMEATEFPLIAGELGKTFSPEDINLSIGETLVFNTEKTPSLDITSEESPAGVYVSYGSNFIGFWKDTSVDTDIHFGIMSYDNTNFAVVEDIWNTTDGWKKEEFELTESWTHTGAWTMTNSTGLTEGSFALSDISIKRTSSITPDTVLYAIKSPTPLYISVTANKGDTAIDWDGNGVGINLKNHSKEVETSPSIDLSMDSLEVSETFYEETETGFEVTISSDGTLPKGLIDGNTYYVIKTGTEKVIKLASTLGNAEAGIPVDILDAGTLDPVQNQYHHIVDKHNELYTGYKRRIGYLYTSSPTDEEIYYKLYHYPYGKEENWSDFDQSCADLVKEPGAFLVILYKKYDDQYLEVERHTVSRNEAHVDGYGRNIYVEKVFESSNYVRWKDNKGVSTNVYPCNQTTYAKLTGGSLGHAATTGECITALKLFGNKRRYPITLIMDGGWSIPEYQQAIIDVCESRGSTLGILSTPIEVEQSSNYLEDLLAYRRKSLITSTSHAALYTPHVKIYDEYNDREIWISPTGHVGACISDTATNYEPWYAPAGNTRGVLNVLGVAREFNDGDEDALYDAGINPIDFHETYGIRIWGQKTLLNRASALDRVNVRMLLITIEPAIEALLMDYVFEANDDFSREMIVSKLDPYLASIQARRGFYAYKVICDSSNNTNEVIDNNELIADIAIQPTRVAELIKGRLFINSTGALLTVA